MNRILISSIVMALLGLFFALVLSWASKKFAIEQTKQIDPQKLKQIVLALPKTNCGRCGYANCGAFAKAILEGNAPVDGCVVGKEEVAKKIEEIIGNKNQNL